MAITIGLDFGTHQTKLCIENSDDPYHKTYEFWEWKDGVFTLPSVIQINKDHTLRYGSVDMETCLVARKKKSFEGLKSYVLPPKPIKPELEYPKDLIFPPIPTFEYIDKYGRSRIVPYTDLYGMIKPYTHRAKVDYKEYREWEQACWEIKRNFKIFYDAWRKLTSLLGNDYYPEPKIPDLPEEPFLDGYDYDYDPKLKSTRQQRAEYLAWKNKCKEMHDKYNQKLSKVRILEKSYELQMKQWREDCEKFVRQNERLSILQEEAEKEYPMIFRYFKQATFSSYKWDYIIDSKTLSILFLANIIFQLEDRFGYDFSIQMGIPVSKMLFNRWKPFAAGILIQAIRLVEDVFKNDYAQFLNTPYEELIAKIPEYEYDDDLKLSYGIIILPEAYAALRSLTANSLIPKGMSVVLDVGGGTTDISFFVIEDNGEPHIYNYDSISKGLNFFLEYQDKGQFRDFSNKRELEELNPSVFIEAYTEYKRSVDKSIIDLTVFLHQDTLKRGFHKTAFLDAIRNRPVIYTGGGCYDKRIRNSISEFTDVLHIDKEMLRIRNVVNEDRISVPYSVLATSYGLSIQRGDDNVLVSDKEELFAKYTNIDEKEIRWNSHQEHGMYED